MTWPTTFGAIAGGNQPLSLFDTMFQQVAAISTIPSSAVGTNAISLTPLVNCPTLSAYNELCSFRFRAVGASTGLVTAQFNGLGLLPVYHADGVTQATTGDILNISEYVLTFSQALNAGAGGFFLESPGLAPASASVVAAIATPGGRLTFQSAVPVMSANQLNQQTLFYAPYSGPFIALYNGTTIQSYQFTANNADQVGLSIAMAGSVNWPSGTMFDVFVTLVAGVVTLCSLAWTNTTTRATGLAIFGGFLTNTSIMTARTTAGTIAVAANQGTWVGSFFASANGTSQWQFGGSASGGTAGLFYLYNYYNQVLVNSVITDSGATYNYTSASVRQARASTGNGFTYVQGSSERAALFDYVTSMGFGVATSIANLGIAINSTTVFNAVSSIVDNSATSNNWSTTTHYGAASTGLTTANALEQTQVGGTQNLNFNSNNKFIGHIWL